VSVSDKKEAFRNSLTPPLVPDEGNFFNFFFFFFLPKRKKEKKVQLVLLINASTPLNALSRRSREEVKTAPLPLALLCLCGSEP
jgi:hypothetical protein